MNRMTMLTITLLISGFLVSCEQPTTPVKPVTPVNKYKIGDKGPAGGYIFFVDIPNRYPDWKYLEAAPLNWDADDDYTDPILKCGQRNYTCGRNNKAIGEGFFNTLALINHSNCEVPHDAALQVYYSDIDQKIKREINGFSEWFLPSIDELEAMYNNLHNRPIPLGHFDEAIYWSSSRYDKSLTWEKEFRKEPFYDLGTNDKEHKVRPIRAF